MKADESICRVFSPSWRAMLYSLRERWLYARGIEPASPQFSFHVAKAHFSSTWPPWPHFLPRGNNEATIGPYHIGPLKKLNNIQPDFRISLPHRSHNNMILALSYELIVLLLLIHSTIAFVQSSCPGHAEYHSYSL